MIDNFLGIDTGGDTGHCGFCHRMRHAVMILFFLKDRSSLQYFITQGMGQSSMFHTFHSICKGGLRLWVGWEEGKEEFQGGSIPFYYEACLKTQPAHKPLITRRGSFPLRGFFVFKSHRRII